jgi:DNA repair protein RadC
VLVKVKPAIKQIKFNKCNIVADLMQQIYRRRWIDKNKEHFFTIGLKRNCTLIYVDLASVGTLHSSLIDARLIFKPAIIKSAASIILVHNHPSGNINPSESDKLLTRNMLRIGKLMDIPIMDHIIIGGDSYYSFANEEELY